MKTRPVNRIMAPIFLVEADSYQRGCEKVSSFLENTSLIQYEQLDFSHELSYSAQSEKFWTTAEAGLCQNQESIDKLIEELEEDGCRKLKDIARMNQGYESKLLHTLVHLVDGFIGVDTKFYNLVEDSHQISAGLMQRIKNNPHSFLLLQVQAENPETLI